MFSQSHPPNVLRLACVTRRMQRQCCCVASKAGIKEQSHFSFVHLFFKDFIYFQRKRKGGRETSLGGRLLCAPHWEPGPQPSHVPRLGIEPATLWFAGWHSIHSVTPARAASLTFRSYAWRGASHCVEDTSAALQRGFTRQGTETSCQEPTPSCWSAEETLLEAEPLVLVKRSCDYSPSQHLKCKLNCISDQDHQHSAKLFLNSDPQKVRDVKVHYYFKLQNLGAICHIVTDNRRVYAVRQPKVSEGHLICSPALFYRVTRSIRVRPQRVKTHSALAKL